MNLLAAPKPYSCFYVWLKMVVLYINFKCYCCGHSRYTLVYVLLRTVTFNTSLYKMSLQSELAHHTFAPQSWQYKLQRGTA